MGIIVDIDNTLLHDGIFPIQKTIDKIANERHVYLITGRPETERAKTVETLKKYGINYSALLMNSLGNNPHAQLLSKQQNAHRLLQHVSISAAIDDNGPARAMYKALGIPNVMGP